MATSGTATMAPVGAHPTAQLSVPAVVRPEDAIVLVGREVEAAALRGLVEDVAAGRGGVAWVEGAAGIGKSALIAAGIADAVRRGCAVYAGTADELSRPLPLRAVLDCLGLARSVGADSPPNPPTLGVPRPGDSTARLAARVMEIVERMCAASPVVLMLDDLHHADEVSVRVWGELAELVRQLPLLLISGCRPVPRADLRELRRALTRLGAATLRLSPLDEERAAQLAGQLVGGAPGVRLRQMLGVAGGNPLYLREIAKAVRRRDALVLCDGVAEIADADHFEVPASITAAITDRLLTVAPEALPVLRVAALLGTDCLLDELAVVLQEPVEWLAPVLRDAVSTELLADAGPMVSFRHPLIREALAGQLPAAVRSAVLQHAASVLAKANAEPRRVASFLIAAPDADGEWIGDWLASFSPELSLPAGTAEHLLDRALNQMLDGDPRRERLEMSRLYLYHLQRRDEETERLGRTLLGRNLPADQAAAVAWALTYSLINRNRYDDAAQISRRWAGAIDITPRWRARLTALTAVTCQYALQFDEAVATATRALELAEQAGDGEAAGFALNVLCSVASQRGEFEESAEANRRALLAVGDDPELTDLRLLLLLNRAVVLVNSDQVSEIGPALREVLGLAEDSASGRLTQIRTVSADIYYKLGRWDDALAALTASGDPGVAYLSVIFHGLSSAIAIRRNERLAAGRHQPDTPVCPETYGRVAHHATQLLLAQAMIELRANRPDQALSALAPLLDPEHGEMYADQEMARPWQARLAMWVGDTATATATAAVAERYAAQAATVGTAAAAAHCRGLAERDPHRVLAAADQLRACGWLVCLADALEDAAVLLAAHGDPDRARAAQAEAATLYEQFGAEWDLRRLDARLRPYGIRRGQRGVRNRPRSGWSALTPTEQRVAHLVGQGMSNPEIAEELVMSRRTVQTHVSSILTKLNARSRAEIAHATIRASSTA